jgi:hypothetical protein
MASRAFFISGETSSSEITSRLASPCKLAIGSPRISTMWVVATGT